MENVPKFFVYLQLKDEAQLALKKMPSSEQEALSLVCDIPFLIFMFCLVLFLILWILFYFLIIIITVESQACVVVRAILQCH
jgi:hypothetical protein